MPPGLVSAGSRRDPNHSEVAITIVIAAICRIFTHDPERRMRSSLGIRAEHYEVVITLVACGLKTSWVIEVEQCIRVTTVQWRGGIRTGCIRTVEASRFAHVAIVIAEIPGWREGDACADRSRCQCTRRFTTPSEEHVPGPQNGARRIGFKPAEFVDFGWNCRRIEIQGRPQWPTGAAEIDRVVTRPRSRPLWIIGH
jgi:hypothetical protein